MGYDADAMVVATATPDGAPSARVVLLKGVDERGLVFFTNYSSRKGAELDRNPRAALLFYWHPLGRQVRVEGAVSRVDRAESEAYAHSRPRQSQLSALASPQSEVVPDRAWLERRVEELDPRAPGGRPAAARATGAASGVAPDTWEFWENRDNRLHDRHRYSRADGRLAGRAARPLAVRDTAGSRSRGRARACRARRRRRAGSTSSNGAPPRRLTVQPHVRDRAVDRVVLGPVGIRVHPAHESLARRLDRPAHLARRGPTARTCTGPGLGRPCARPQRVPVARHAQRAVRRPTAS